MTYRTSLIQVVASISLCAGAAMGGSGACAIAGLISDRAIVGLNDGNDIQVFIDLFNAEYPNILIELLDSIPGRNIHLVGLDFSKVDPIELPALLSEIEEVFFAQFDPDIPGPVRFAEGLYESEAPEGGTGSFWLGIPDGTPQLTQQYAWDLLNIDPALQLSEGQGATIAVIDTGVDAQHPVLQGSVLPAIGYNFIEDNSVTGDIAAQADSDGDGFIDEMTGHGTFVAGLIATVAPQAKIVPMTALDSNGNGNLYVLAKAMYHAIDLGVDVMNISISSTYKSEAVEEACDEARDKGIVIVTAAGNCGTEEPEQWPAYDNSTFGVIATDHDDVKAEFSNFSDELFICAPGNTVAVDGEPVMSQAVISILPNGEYAAWSGTSFSAPLMAGAVALVRAQFPTAARNESLFELIQNKLRVSADDICPQNPQYCQEGNDQLLGAGRANIGDAVALGPPAPPLGDLNLDGTIGPADLGALLAAWGPCPAPPAHCMPDLTGDNVIGPADLGELLARWTN